MTRRAARTGFALSRTRRATKPIKKWPTRDADKGRVIGGVFARYDKYSRRPSKWRVELRLVCGAPVESALALAPQGHGTHPRKNKCKPVPPLAVNYIYDAIFAVRRDLFRRFCRRCDLESGSGRRRPCTQAPGPPLDPHRPCFFPSEIVPVHMRPFLL